MPNFKFKPFSEMNEIDYAEIGFKSGLEVHQQLLTEKKLFCRCPAGLYSQHYDAEILRHMRPTLSELGEYDGTALMEFKTKKNIIYRINRNTVCTYEMDDTPPFEINEQALDIAIEIGLLMNAKIVDEIHIARKQYLDGSIPTGFQRTAIISVGGYLPYKNRVINLIQMSLEEDSCREYSDNGHFRTYLTDRLGMPLIETVTEPEMKTPFEVAEVNNIIRKLARSTGKVRTGVGAAREDVNVSVTGGTRIEIKGVPSIKRIPLLTYNEAMRQWNLLRLRDELKKRGISKDNLETKIEDVTKILKKTRYRPIADAIAIGYQVKCVLLKGFKKLLLWQTQTNTNFAKEISDRVRVIACLTDLPNIIYSDAIEDTISLSEGKMIRVEMGATDDDALVCVWGDNKDVELASKEIIERAREATIGIPSETRQALKDGTNGFERILPGPDRMYPDTDLPPKKVTKERLDRIRINLTEQFWIREQWYMELGVPKDIIPQLAISKFASLFKKCVNEYKMNPTFVAVLLIQYPKRLRRKGVKLSNLTVELMSDIIDKYRNNEVFKDYLLYYMEDVVRNGTIDNSMPEKISINELRQTIIEINNYIQNDKLYKKENKAKLMLGLLMKELRGRVSFQDVLNELNKFIKQQIDDSNQKNADSIRLDGEQFKGIWKEEQ